MASLKVGFRQLCKCILWRPVGMFAETTIRPGVTLAAARRAKILSPYGQHPASPIEIEFRVIKPMGRSPIKSLKLPDYFVILLR